MITSDIDTGDTVKYHIQIDDDENFDSVLIDYLSPLGTPTTETFTTGQLADDGSYTTGEPDQTLSDGTYWWRAKAIDNKDADSGWFNARSFIVDTTAPNTPAGLTIKVADKIAKIVWSNPADPNFSEVKIYRQQGGANNNTNPIDITETNSASATEALVEDLTNDIEYTFWLSALDSLGNESNISQKLTVMPGAERVYRVPDLIDSSLSVSAGSTSQVQDSKLFSYLIGQGISNQNYAPLVIVKNSKIKFGLVDKNAHLSKLTDISDISTSLTGEDISKMEAKILAVPINNNWAVIYTSNDSLYYSQSADELGTSFSKPVFISAGISAWDIKLLQRDDGKLAIAALSADKKQIIAYEQDNSTWTERILEESNRPIFGFDASIDLNGYNLVYGSSQIESSNILGRIINAFKVDDVIIAKASTSKEQVLYKGRKTVSPKMISDDKGNDYAIFWSPANDGGIEYYNFSGTKWEKLGRITGNNQSYSFSGDSQISASWDYAKGLLVAWNANKDEPTTYFGYAKDGVSRIYRSLNAQTTIVTPKITKFGDNKFIYIIGNSGFVYTK